MVKNILQYCLFLHGNIPEILYVCKMKYISKYDVQKYGYFNDALRRDMVVFYIIIIYMSIQMTIQF